MVELSAIIIAKNSEEVIADCLQSVKFADEIILVDAGSTDKTNSIAIHFGAKIVKGVAADFAKQRNIGKQAARGEWLLYVDTDERVTPSLRDEIVTCINNPLIQYAAFRIKRQNFYLGNHPWPTIEKLERLFKKHNLIEWFGTLHETAKIQGNIGDLSGYLEHYTHRDLFSMTQKTIQWSDIEAKLRFDAHHPPLSWWRFLRVMMTAFFDSYIKQQGYKAGTAGLVESIYQALSMFITYAKLWELQDQKNSI